MHSLQTLRLRALRGGKVQLAEQLTKQLAEINHTGVCPEVSGPMIAHCGQWHKVQLPLPMAVPCCGVLVLHQQIQFAHSTKEEQMGTLNRYYRLKAQGLCPECGKEKKESAHHVVCKCCILKHRIVGAVKRGDHVFARRLRKELRAILAKVV